MSPGGARVSRRHRRPVRAGGRVSVPGVSVDSPSSSPMRVSVTLSGPPSGRSQGVPYRIRLSSTTEDPPDRGRTEGRTGTSSTDRRTSITRHSSRQTILGPGGPVPELLSRRIVSETIKVFTRPVRCSSRLPYGSVPNVSSLSLSLYRPEPRR